MIIINFNKTIQTTIRCFLIFKTLISHNFQKFFFQKYDPIRGTPGCLQQKSFRGLVLSMEYNWKILNRISKPNTHDIGLSNFELYSACPAPTCPVHLTPYDVRNLSSRAYSVMSESEVKIHYTVAHSHYRLTTGSHSLNIIFRLGKFPNLTRTLWFVPDDI